MQHVLRLRPVPGASLTLPCGGADSASICSLICLTVALSSATSFFNSCIVKCKFSALRNDHQDVVAVQLEQSDRGCSARVPSSSRSYL